MRELGAFGRKRLVVILLGRVRVEAEVELVAPAEFEPRPRQRIVRCAATEVNPDNGERDAKPMRWLREHFGHGDLGVYAEVLEGGRIAVGDALEPAEGDLLH